MFYDHFVKQGTIKAKEQHAVIYQIYQIFNELFLKMTLPLSPKKFIHNYEK